MAELGEGLIDGLHVIATLFFFALFLRLRRWRSLDLYRWRVRQQESCSCSKASDGEAGMWRRLPMTAVAKAISISCHHQPARLVARCR